MIIDQNYKINDDMYGFCYPTICISYSRIYFNCHNIRLTIDTDIKYRKISFVEVRSRF